MVIQNPVSGCQYTFEFNDRLIRDNEFDGWTEVPVKLDNDVPEKATADADVDIAEQNEDIRTPSNNSLSGMIVV